VTRPRIELNGRKSHALTARGLIRLDRISADNVHLAAFVDEPSVSGGSCNDASACIWSYEGRVFRAGGGVDGGKTEGSNNATLAPGSNKGN
jgi:hypothetical protein